MATVVLHYWAGAKAAAGVEYEQYEASSVADAVAQAGEVSDRPGLVAVLGACAFLVDGLTQSAHDLDTFLTADRDVEVLPPFAGGG
ncbi:MAG: MoaD/ThiS family protein [Propionibacteriaceae bacterium]